MLIPLTKLVALPAPLLYALFFPIAIIEGPIITIIAGFLAAHNIVNFLLVYLILAAGDVAGDIFYYAVGRWGRMSFINRWGKYIGITETKIQELEGHFVRHSGKTILFSKIAHGIGTLFLVAAGVSKMPLGRFIFYNTIGTIPKTLILLLAGYFFGQAYAQIGKYFDYAAIGGIALGVALIIIYVFVGRFLKKKEKDL